MFWNQLSSNSPRPCRLLRLPPINIQTNIQINIPHRDSYHQLLVVVVVVAMLVVVVVSKVVEVVAVSSFVMDFLVSVIRWWSPRVMRSTALVWSTYSATIRPTSTTSPTTSPAHPVSIIQLTPPIHNHLLSVIRLLILLRTILAAVTHRCMHRWRRNEASNLLIQHPAIIQLTTTPPHQQQQWRVQVWRQSSVRVHYIWISPKGCTPTNTIQLHPIISRTILITIITITIRN